MNEQTLLAMELLLDAVAREMRPELLDLKVAARTLRDALDHPGPGSLAVATRAFNAIAADTRRRIRESAVSAAVAHTARARAAAEICGGGEVRTISLGGPARLRLTRH